MKTLPQLALAHPSLVAATPIARRELPQDILMDIFALLDIPDLVRAGLVCASVYALFSTNANQFGCSMRVPKSGCALYG
jgi:hypothetical protein